MSSYHKVFHLTGIQAQRWKHFVRKAASSISPLSPLIQPKPPQANSTKDAMLVADSKKSWLKSPVISPRLRESRGYLTTDVTSDQRALGLRLVSDTRYPLIVVLSTHLEPPTQGVCQ